MAQRVGGFRRKTRSKLRIKQKDKSPININKFTQEFKPGERVHLKANPKYQKGMYFPRFHGLSGLVTKKKGQCYYVKIKDNNKEKSLIIHPIHLQKCQK